MATFGRFRLSSVKSQKLLCRAKGIPVDRRISQFQPVTKQQPDLYVPDNQSEKGAKRFICFVKMQETGIATELQQWLEPTSHGEGSVL